jgi:nicotinamide-nucleotide amidase
MAQGVKQLLDTDCAIAVSGIAGPGGGTPAKPVGLVYIGIATPQTTHSYEYRFSGNREEVRHQAVAEALRRLGEVVE